MRSKMSMSVSWLARTSIAACERCYDGPREGTMKDTHREKDSDSCKDHFRGRENLGGGYERVDLGRVHSLRLTRLTPSPRVFEKASKTLTVGSSQFVSLSSPLWSPWT